ncbi:MAG: hypothetical protein PSN34_11055 [Urechidicola sp.]|nr:hypothetical protein [Urechidicola sp.]
MVIKRIKEISFLTMISIFIISCSEKTENEVQNIEQELSRIKFENTVINSEEYNNYIMTFRVLRDLDEKVFLMAKNARENDLISEDEFSKYFTNLIVQSKRKQNIIFLEKIGLEDSNEYLKKRDEVFNQEIPNAVEKLGNKFPKLKSYTQEQMELLLKNFKDVNDEK